MTKVLMSGNAAIGEAAIRAGCEAYFGYPITPQTEALEHMAAVNAISAEEVDAIVRQAICHWKFRSQQSWKLAVDPDLLSRFPELAVVESRVASPREGARRLVFGKEPHDPRF